MAYSTFNAATEAGFSLRSVSAAVGSAVSGFFENLGRALVAASTSNERLDQAALLHAKSDAELAAMGIKRDDIVRHVFRDVLFH